ncbi:unnamed protein product [Peniophora sp. CBMAI 1063]|nr:unnamed protein product [Peniophora sp. CBMAI 1063]
MASTPRRSTSQTRAIASAAQPAPSGSVPRRRLPKFKKIVNRDPGQTPSTPQPPRPAVRKKLPSDVDVVVRWSNNTGLLGVGTTYRPPDVRQGVARDSGFGLDGLWRWHELLRQPGLLDGTSPYIAWIKIPTIDEKENNLMYRRAQRRDCALHPEVFVEGRKRRGMGVVHGMYRVTDELYADMQELCKDLRRKCDAATRLLRRAINARLKDVKSTSVIHRIVDNVRDPVREYLDVVHACELLRYGCLSTFEDFDICFTAFQRASVIMQAYVDFVLAIIPMDMTNGLATLPSKTSSAFRRGVILSGRDIEAYVGFFKRLCIPVWIYADLNEVDIPLDKFGPADLPRCDVALCQHLNSYRQRVLPMRWYPPPPDCTWSLVEPIARGYLPRPDQATFKLGDEAQRKKRKIEASQKHQQRRIDKEERALKRAQKVFGDLGPSLVRYKELTARSPAARRYFIHKLKPRPTFAPRVLPRYAACESDAERHLSLLAPPLQHPVPTSHPDFLNKSAEVPRDVLDNAVKQQLEQRLLKTFIPPLCIFTATTTWKKTVMYVSNAVRLLPSILDRVPTSRVDPHVQPLGPSDWRAILSINHWKKLSFDTQRQVYVNKRLHQLREELEEGEALDEVKERANAMKDKIDLEPYDHKTWYKYGSLQFYGQHTTDLIMDSENPTVPSIGKLPCGCDATEELLLEDPDLVTAILTWFEQLRLMHWFAELLSVSLSEEGTSSMPDFRAGADAQTETVMLIRKLVLHLQSVGMDGWPVGRDDLFDENYVARALTKVLVRANCAEDVDKFCANDDLWISTSTLKGVHYERLDQTEFQYMLDHLYMRYILTSFAAKQWPVEFNELLHPQSLYCQGCRQRLASPLDSPSPSPSQDEDSDHSTCDPGDVPQDMAASSDAGSPGGLHTEDEDEDWRHYCRHFSDDETSTDESSSVAQDEYDYNEHSRKEGTESDG